MDRHISDSYGWQIIEIHFFHFRIPWKRILLKKMNSYILISVNQKTNEKTLWIISFFDYWEREKITKTFFSTSRSHDTENTTMKTHWITPLWIVVKEKKKTVDKFVIVITNPSEWEYIKKKTWDFHIFESYVSENMMKWMTTFYFRLLWRQRQQFPDNFERIRIPWSRTNMKTDWNVEYHEWKKSIPEKNIFLT